MKRIILLMLVVFFSLPALAQKTNDLFSQLTEKYADKDGFSASQLTSDMFDLYIKKKNVDEPSPVFEALKNLDNIMVVSQSNINNVNWIEAGKVKTETESEDNELHDLIISHYKNNSYTLLKTEKRMGEDVKVYLKKAGEIIESLALVTKSSASTSLVELKGNIDLKTVAQLNQALNLRGLENLYKIDNNGSAFFGLSSGIGRAYPQARIEEYLSKQREEFEKQRELTDEQRAKIEEQAKIQAKKQLEMAEKYREMAEKYRRQPIFLSYPGDTNTVYYIDGKKVKADKIKELDKEKIESVNVDTGKEKNDKTTVRIETKK